MNSIVVHNEQYYLSSIANPHALMLAEIVLAVELHHLCLQLNSCRWELQRPTDDTLLVIVVPMDQCHAEHLRDSWECLSIPL